MRKIEMIAGLGMAILMLGCTQSPELAKMKTVQLSDGNSYSVPVGSSYTNQAVDAKVIAFYNKVGISECKQGDITWENAEVADEINSILRSGTREEGIDVYKKAAKKGDIGCASPLK